MLELVEGTVTRPQVTLRTAARYPPPRGSAWATRRLEPCQPYPVLEPHRHRCPTERTPDFTKPLDFQTKAQALDDDLPDRRREHDPAGRRSTRQFGTARAGVQTRCSPALPPGRLPAGRSSGPVTEPDRTHALPGVGRARVRAGRASPVTYTAYVYGDARMQR